MITAAQALLVQSALKAMSQQSRNSSPETQHASAGANQPSSTEAGQLRAEYDVKLAATAERAQEVRAQRLVHITKTHCRGIAVAVS